MNRILQRDASTLRKKAKEVAKKDIGTPRLNKIIAELKRAMGAQDDGVAIAAPQLGYSLRLFVVSGKVEKIIRAKERREYSDRVFINPRITKRSKKTEEMEEGCLSVRYLYGKVRRSTKVTIEALDENGKKITRGASGLLAQVFQHETDHLNGVLFTDKAVGLRELPPEKRTHK